MKTASQASEELCNASDNLKRFEELINDAIKNNINSFNISSINFSERELEIIEEHGYFIRWNRALLEYEVEF